MPPTTDTHNEGSCDLCTGWHDAEEAAFMNKRRTPPPTDTEPRTTPSLVEAVRIILINEVPSDEAWRDLEAAYDAALAAERASGGRTIPEEAEAGPCPGGCNCRLYSPDADPADCGCDSYCTMDTTDWPKWPAERASGGLDVIRAIIEAGPRERHDPFLCASAYEPCSGEHEVLDAIRARLATPATNEVER